MHSLLHTAWGTGTTIFKRCLVELKAAFACVKSQRFLRSSHCMPPACTRSDAPWFELYTCVLLTCKAACTYTVPVCMLYVICINHTCRGRCISWDMASSPHVSSRTYTGIHVRTMTRCFVPLHLFLCGHVYAGRDRHAICTKNGDLTSIM